MVSFDNMSLDFTEVPYLRTLLATEVKSFEIQMGYPSDAPRSLSLLGLGVSLSLGILEIGPLRFEKLEINLQWMAKNYPGNTGKARYSFMIQAETSIENSIASSSTTAITISSSSLCYPYNVRALGTYFEQLF